MAPVPAHVRNAFLDLLNDETQGDPACQLAASVLGCEDPLPLEYCEMLGLPNGTTFDQAAAHVRQSLGCPE